MNAELRQWLRSARGQALQGAEAALLDDALADCFGWETLQIGAWGEGRALLGGARTRSRGVIASSDDAAPDVLARLTQLPVASDSIDAVILPHTLEFEADPYGVLREVDRVLAGEGKLIVLGFAPWSPWGLRAAATRRGHPPQLRRTLSLQRMRDWVSVLGYDVLETRHYLYGLPWGEPRAGVRSLRRGLYPLPAGAYLLKARKRLHALTPLRPRLRERRTVLAGLTEPTSANSSVNRTSDR